ncbi:MAG: hypothetical protein GF311_14065 [Candidatus Lokiarchaeota archaeon]|nr:hypothetical protein [Candidatus Lokiarchaeota archaeon]
MSSKLQKKIDKQLQKIGKKGWKPKLGVKLGDLYYDNGDLNNAEMEYFKYLDATKSQENVPSWIYMKWAAENSDQLDIKAGGPGGDLGTFMSFSPKNMMAMYEMGKENYLKKHEKI